MLFYRTYDSTLFMTTPVINIPYYLIIQYSRWMLCILTPLTSFTFDTCQVVTWYGDLICSFSCDHKMIISAMITGNQNSYTKTQYPTVTTPCRNQTMVYPKVCHVQLDVSCCSDSLIRGCLRWRHLTSMNNTHSTHSNSEFNHTSLMLEINSKINSLYMSQDIYRTLTSYICELGMIFMELNGNY
jgi:hypothetical protein